MISTDITALSLEIDHNGCRRSFLRTAASCCGSLTLAILIPSPASATSYQVEGAPSDILELVLNPGDRILSEPGTLVFMDDAIEMSIQSRGGGGFTRFLAGGKFFVVDYTNKGSKPARLALGTEFPSRIVPLKLEDHGEKLYGKIHSFLASSSDVRLDAKVEFVRGSVFILESIEGKGTVFLTGSGNIVAKTLQKGEVIRASRGALVALDNTVTYQTVFVQGGLSTVLLGGQGLFLTKLTGPGTVWLDSAPIDGLVKEVAKRVESNESSD